MTSRFKQFMVSDSDDDSSDSEVLQRREQRSSNLEAASSLPSSPAAAPQGPIVAVAAAGDTSTPFQGGANETKNNPKVSSSRQSLKLGVAASTPLPSEKNSSPAPVPALAVQSLMGSVRTRDSPQMPISSQDATAPRDDSERSFPAAANREVQRTDTHSLDGTPNNIALHESAHQAADDDDGKQAGKVLRRKVVVRRKRRANPNDPGEVVRVDEQVIRPGRVTSSAPSPQGAAQPQLVAPLPSRLSPRARRAAESRSASRAATPTNKLHTPAGEQPEPAPQIPTRLPGSRGNSPRSLHGVSQSSEVLNKELTSHIGLSKAKMPPAQQPSEQGSRPSTAGTSARRSNRSTKVEDSAEILSMTPNFRAEDTVSSHLDRGLATVAPQHSVNRSTANLNRHPQIPSPSALDESPTPYTEDASGLLVPMHRAKVRLTTTVDGRTAWMLFDPYIGDAGPAAAQEIPAPPRKLSRRAQDILAAKRRSLEESVRKRRAEPQRHRLSSIRNPVRFTFPESAFYSAAVARHHEEVAASLRDQRWTQYAYDGIPSCVEVRRRSATVPSRPIVENIVRVLQPIQVAPEKGSADSCGCVLYYPTREDAALQRLLDSSAVRDESISRYLNLQPMQLANVETQQMIDPPLESPRRRSVTSVETHGTIDLNHKSPTEPRGVATLGGLWCTVELLNEEGRPVARKTVRAPRRIMRICGGQALRVSSRHEAGDTFEVRCYELLLFACESLSPSAVRYGSDGLTLGQMVDPPASSFPLTPRIVDDPVALKEYKKRLLMTKNRQVAIVNGEDDRATFSPPASGANSKASTANEGTYLTLTLVTISARQKFTIELTLVLLPFRCGGIFGGKTVAEIPRFCATTVMSYRRLQSFALSFSTKAAFMSAYKALLWATECNIVDVQPPDREDMEALSRVAYAKLRVCATASPMMPWVTSLGKSAAGSARESTFHGSCVDFAVLMQTTSSNSTEDPKAPRRGPLTLEDFVIVEGEHHVDTVNNNTQPKQEITDAPQVRRSSIFTSTLISPRTADGEESHVPVSDTAVGLAAFGVIRRAVHQKTAEVFDVRVMPRNRGRMVPISGAAAVDQQLNAVKRQTAKGQEDLLLEQDAEAAVMLEYVTRLPFHSRVFGVLVDEQRYYIFQEPWISALSLEESMVGSVEREALECNETLKTMMNTTTVMSLKDFIHAVLCPSGRGLAVKEEARLEIAHVLIAQLLLLVTSLHGKGMLLGPCPPQRLLVRIIDPAKENQNEERSTTIDTPKSKESSPSMKSANITLFVPDMGVNTLAWSYERQQCGVLEYLPPMYIFEQMLCDSMGKEERPWTMHDDWWTFLTLSFEMLAGDGSALVTPENAPTTPTPTPTLTQFLSPVDVMQVWENVITDTTGGIEGTATEVIGQRTRRYVHQRVLKSISRFLDSWVATKAEELQYMGTTADPRERRAARAVPPPPSDAAGKTVGVSLAAVYLHSMGEVSETSSNVPEPHRSEGREKSNENVLEGVQWVFQIRDFFDTILDTVFTDTGCAVHGPTLRLISHPLLRALPLEKVFDGTHVYSIAVRDYAARHLGKGKLQSALLAYRTRAYRGPRRARPEMPLMITGTPYNVCGRASMTGPLLLLPALQLDEPAVCETVDWTDGRGSENGASEGLVLSRTSSAAQLHALSPRSQSQATTSSGQQKSKEMYNPEEWRSIAALENEVRGALQPCGPRDSVLSRRTSADAESVSNQVTISNRPMQPPSRSKEAMHTDAVSAISSSERRRDPRDYELVVESKPAHRSAVLHQQQHAPPRSSAHSGVNDTINKGTPGGTAERTYEKENLSLYMGPLQQQSAHNSEPVVRRDSHRLTPMETEGRGRNREERQPRRHHHSTNSSDTQRSFHDPAKYPSDNHGASVVASSQQSYEGSAGSHRHGHLQLSSHGSGRLPLHNNQRMADDRDELWPNAFLDAATVHKKGGPHRLSEVQETLDSAMLERRTHPAELGGRFHRHGIDDGKQTPASEVLFQETSSDDSFVLVASDDELEIQQGPAFTNQSGAVNRESPAPRYPRDSHTNIIA